ncbi:VOC family protein [Pseudomonas putida]|uniref:VOC family protein n=1 Tax=Pseudomonas putida TaxID=303 RepID=UPI00383B7EFD
MPLSPLLRCNDLQKTREHYRETLGFEVADSQQATLTVHLDDNRILFTEQDLWGHSPHCTGTFYFVIADVDGYFERVREKADIAWPLQDMPYGSLEFGVRDCNGYFLAFTQAR